jgi:NAD(P)-dependent dehydrogenase (short-subunit alcohol dehydrogenase family)
MPAQPASSTRTAIVTGAERGIGLAIARTLLEDGYRVVLAGIDEAAAARNLPALQNLGPAKFIRCDVGVESEVAAMVEQTLAEFGGLDALVCNAGLARAENPPLPELTLEYWDKVMRVNVTGAFLCAKHCVAALRARRGAIVIISSTRAHASEPNTEAYSTSKAALIGLNHSLANSLGPEIRVNAVCPGWINIADDYDFSPEEHGIQLTGRVGVGADVATVVKFLLDPAQSAFIEE